MFSFYLTFTVTDAKGFVSLLHKKILKLKIQVTTNNTDRFSLLTSEVCYFLAKEIMNVFYSALSFSSFFFNLLVAFCVCTL